MNYGYELAAGSIVILSGRGSALWKFAAIALNKRSGVPLGELAQELGKFGGPESFPQFHARNWNFTQRKIVRSLRNVWSSLTLLMPIRPIVSNIH